MFTGIIEELGTVETLEAQGDAVRLTVRGPVVTDVTVLAPLNDGDDTDVRITMAPVSSVEPVETTRED